MKLEPLLTMKVNLGGRHFIGHTPKGRRSVWALIGGEAVGPKIRAVVLPLGGEFELVDRDGVYHLDVRLVLRTEDEASIYVQYYGVAERNADTDAALAAGQALDFGQQHFFTQPRFEAGEGQYAWLNRVVAVAEGRMAPAGVEYRVYQCVSAVAEDVAP